METAEAKGNAQPSLPPQILRRSSLLRMTFGAKPLDGTKGGEHAYQRARRRPELAYQTGRLAEGVRVIKGTTSVPPVPYLQGGEEFPLP